MQNLIRDIRIYKALLRISIIIVAQTNWGAFSRLISHMIHAVRILVQANDGQTKFDHSLETQYDHYDLVQQFGTIILNKNSIVIKPQQNAFSEHYGHKPLKFLF